MRRWCLGVAFLAGCYRPATEAPCVVTCNYNAERACPGNQQCMADNLCHAPGGGCGDPGDAMPVDGTDASDVTDGPTVDDPPGSLCFGRGTGSGRGLLRVCTNATPMASVMLAGTVNTDTFQLCAPHVQGPGLSDLCVVWGITVGLASGSTVRLEGSRPLVLVGIQGITIEGTLDAASHIDSMTAGPGADAPQCSLPSPPMFSGNGGAGGAAGGTGQGAGGAGGRSGSASQGTPGAPTTLTGVRGGCSGGLGLSTDAQCTRGLGGGAVYLISSTAITITATGAINASGGAARGGGGSGCGAGSGGLIGFDAAQINQLGKLFANGGGGSSGANGGASIDGNDSASPQIGGLGGFNSAGGSGGNGAAAATLVGSPGASVATNLHGGGGGGGAGWIVVYGGASIPASVNVSPPATSP
jgi:hypothetical protein